MNGGGGRSKLRNSDVTDVGKVWLDVEEEEEREEEGERGNQRWACFSVGGRRCVLKMLKLRRDVSFPEKLQLVSGLW